MTDPSATLDAACRFLDGGRLDAAIAAIGELAEQEIAAECVLLCAKGAMLERAGEDEAARVCFEEVLATRPPIPAILRACGRYFKRCGELDKSFVCFATLAAITPQALDEFTRDLSGPDLSRYAPLLMPRLTTGPNPSFYGMQPVKEALARELGAVGAAHALTELTGAAPGKRVREVRLRGLQDFAREHGARYEEIYPAKRVQLPATQVFGAPDLPGLETEARAFFIARVRDAIVTAKSNLLLVGGEALLDYQADELEKVPLNLDVDPVVVSAAGHELTVSVRDPATSRGSVREALALTGVHSHDFGHWMIEFLPKLWACLEQPEFSGVALIVDDAMPVQHLEALRLFAGPDHPVITLAAGESVIVERLWAPSMIVYMPLGPKPGADCAPDLLSLDASYFVGLAARRIARLAITDRPEGPRRIYLARRDSQHRKLINRAEVESWLAARGFEILLLETLSFEQQVAAIRAADVILGPSGSSFFMCFFARPGTLVVELTSGVLDDFEWFSAVCGALGVTYAVIGGELCREDPRYRTFSDYRIGTELLSRFLSHRGIEPGRLGGAQKIMAFLGVKDEVELVEGAIANLRAIGVDAIGVADLGSPDGTLEILRTLDAQGAIALVQYDETDDKFLSADAPQFRALIERFRPDWVMLSDADERWITERGSIHETIAHHGADILVVNRLNVPLMNETARNANDIGVRGDLDFDVAIGGPLVSEELFRRDPGCRWSLATDAPRVIFRADAASGWVGGQHAVVPTSGRPLSVKIATDVFVAHLPITSETRFAAKLGNVNRYLKKRIGRADQGRPWHWQRWADIYEKGLTREEFLNQVVSDEELAEARARGTCIRSADVFSGTHLARAPLANRYLGLHWERLSRLDQALAAFRHAIRANPDEAQFHVDAARVLRKLGRRDETLAEIGEALRLAPSNAEAHDILRHLHQDSGEVEKAVEHAREAVRLAPDLVHYRWTLAALLERSGALPEAEQVLATAVALTPAEAASHSRLANLLLRQGRLEEALDSARKAAGGAGAGAGERRLLCTLLEQTGQMEEAVASARAAAASEPQAPEHHVLLGNILLRAKALEEATAVLNSAIERWPDHAPLRRLLSEALRQAGDLVGAIPAARAAAALEPNDGDYRVHLGFLVLQSGEIAEARSILEEAVQLAPRNAFGRRILSGALWRSGAREAALAEARRAVEMQPNWAEFNAHLGHLLVETGSLAEAEPVLRRALEVAPDHVYARRAMERLEAAHKRAEAVAESGAKL